MAEPQLIATEEPEPISGTGQKKKKNKEEKMDLATDKLELSLYRTQLAMVRTATTTTSLGFLLYKLLEEKVHDGTDRPFLHIITPRIIALTLFITGFIGLMSYSIRHVAGLKKINRYSPRFYYSGVMIVSYIILVLTLLLFLGALVNG